jgi:hypothetical protein
MARTNADHPDLSIRVTDFKTIASSDFTSINLKVSSFKVDRNYLPMITFFDLSAHFCLIKCFAELGELLFAISGLSDSHGVDLTTTSLLHFSLEGR